MIDKLVDDLRKRKFFDNFGGKFTYRKNELNALISVKGSYVGMLTISSPFPALVELKLANSKNFIRQVFNPGSPDQFRKQLRCLLSTSLFIR